MSRKLIEDIHYMHAQTSKVKLACDIIDNGKNISILQQDKNGDLKTYTILPKNKAKFRKQLKELLTSHL